MQRLLIISGLAIIALGILWPMVVKIPFGHLPSDIVLRNKGFTIYLPLATSIALSIVVTLILWFFRK